MSESRPAYANADGKVVVFFQNAGKFSYRYSTLGFQEAANLGGGLLCAGVLPAKEVEPHGGEEGRRAGEGRDLLTGAATAAECRAAGLSLPARRPSSHTRRARRPHAIRAHRVAPVLQPHKHASPCI